MSYKRYDKNRCASIPTAPIVERIQFLLTDCWLYGIVRTMQDELVKTTLRIPKSIILMAKKTAIDKDLTLQRLVNEALKGYLGNILDFKKKKTKKRMIRFADKPVGVKIPLSREHIYREL
ncbi:hypothetical protein CO015_01235 [candidate division WWE3 bacterium CG_4_8_14_3_um_filter_42_11]|uniref:Uncharacterized protein n=1 Tax=candidate division WWE3 bacterium CG_4_8_14_3_um_filter_42_11 TaxID=1975076 RepID=A0A2M8G7Q1_UNCKA|nr:MAG: hypothetical protein CO015_01235 [candidate division WWE3 bacterium CG_4_8_14_3_um_filter_42_11]